MDRQIIPKSMAVIDENKKPKQTKSPNRKHKSVHPKQKWTTITAGLWNLNPVNGTPAFPVCKTVSCVITVSNSHCAPGCTVRNLTNAATARSAHITRISSQKELQTVSSWWPTEQSDLKRLLWSIIIISQSASSRLMCTLKEKRFQQLIKASV